MNKKILLTSMLAFLVVAGCQSDSSLDTATDETEPSQEVVEQVVTDGTKEQEQDNNESNTEETSQDDDMEEQNNQSVEVDKIYYMDQNYIIKPMNENVDSKVVLLTFDDGPKKEETVVEMLNILEDHDAKAIFFVNGHRIEVNPELLTTIHEKGQIIGNHAWDHILLDELTNEEIDQQVDDVQDIVETLTGTAPQFFRAPHGKTNTYLREKLAASDILYMNWSNGSLDWSANPDEQNAQFVIDNVMNQLHQGSNILMHENTWTIEALDTLLTKLEEEGYSFVDPAAIDIHYEVE
ncbi:polysaccharide deacetylase family protein [Longirhabdus pacifica]|uniref:polysaccharide deacetylase family protein n=1 Tax=Longirhabdus pacifica TaxID=2305227 RepID=UPI001008E106|nr:polysaccharide deacetylase family protein [Longirhabdus pacifica]